MVPRPRSPLWALIFHKNVKESPSWTPMQSIGMVFFREESENDGPEAHIALPSRVFSKNVK